MSSRNPERTGEGVRPKPKGAWTVFFIFFTASVVGGAALLYNEKKLQEAGEWPTGHRKDNMSNTAAALESYFADYNRYPAPVMLRNYVHLEKEVKATGGWELTSLPTSLTTPVAYMGELLGDPHAPQWALPFVYYSDGAGWILVSTGRDHDYDLQELSKLYTAGMKVPPEEMINRTYDPANGKKSSGDIWLTSEGIYSLQEYER